MIGQTISHYEIIEKLGAGGMGVVYKAQDTKLDRFVALKFLPQYLNQAEEEKKRFIHEAKTASALDHPNICTIYEIDETEDGRMFIAMACYGGESLKDKIERGPLPMDEAIEITIQAAQGLAKAHSKEIVHRDIKSANILVTEDGVAKIVDFGLAKLAGRTMLTKEGTTLGTVAYMSPEQTQGTEIDHRTDIWALGAVLYEMVTGRQPFEGDYEQAVQYSIMNEEPEPMTGLRTGVPMELEQIVNKALAKNPQERYQNVNEVAVDLNRIVKTLGTGKRTSPESRTQQPERARRFRLAATAIVIMVLIVAGFYLFSKGFLTKPDKSIDSIAVLPLDNLSRDPEQDYFVDGMHEALITNLSRISALKVISRTSVMRYQQTEKTMPEIARELGVDALVEGSVLRVGDQVRITAQLIHGSTDEHIWAANYDRDLSNVLTLLNEVAAAIATEIRIKLTSQEIARLGSAGAVNPEAHDAYLQGRYLLNRGTEESTGKAMAYFEQAIAADPDYAPAYAGRADAYLWLDDYDYLPELQAQEQAKAAAQKAIELNESLAEGYSALAHLGLHAWDWATTEGACRRGLELNPSYAMTHQWYAMYLSAFGRFDEAIAEARKAEALDPLSLSRINNVAMQLYHARRFDEAMVQVQRVLEMDPNYPRGLRVLGQIYSGKGMHREAIAQYGKYSSVSKGSTVALAFLGNAYGLAGDRERVLRALDELSTRSKTEYVSAFEMALVYLGVGDTDKALEWLERAYVERSDWLVHMNVTPIFDPVRSDNRFVELVKKMDLQK